MSKTYYLGLDIGTDSVGYAVTDEYYQLQKCKGEPAWGVQTFEAANLAQERRAFRTARRRIDRTQQRVALLNELFATDIGKVDPRFFIRRAESRLFREDAGDNYPVFNDKDFTDKEYYKRYPTIHHLIVDLMQSDAPHDIRLVYLACAWLVAHRGHFLFDVPAENVGELLDFDVVYHAFTEYLKENEYSLPWADEIGPAAILAIMKRNTGVKRKQDAFKAEIYGGKKASKKGDEAFPFSRDAIVTLLSGGKVKPQELYDDETYAEVESVGLGMPDEDFARIVAELGEDGELLLKLRAMQDCAMLIGTQNGKKAISEAKVEVYEQHKRDLAALKKFVKKYLPQEYDAIFRAAGTDNYTAYSYNVKSCKDKSPVKSKADAEKFCKFLLGKVKNVKPAKADEAFYQDMLTRLEANSFLPKQKTTDNRVIPQQLYRYELTELLNRAEQYLPMLRRKDASGLTVKEKICSIFDFRIPYFVGPLNRKSQNAWFERRAEGKLYPWNFKSLVDFDKSEEAFIKRMTNYCTYLAGEEVLPRKSLLYCKYTVLNEINTLKINGNAIPVEVKQKIFTDVFMQRQRVTLKQIETYLRGQGLLFPEDKLSGADEKLNANLSSYHQFRRLLESGTLTEENVERIIARAAYSEDRSRFLRWLEQEYPQITAADRKYIARLNLKEFGRMSGRFLSGILGADETTGEAFTVMEALWNTNNNLMQLLSDRYSFKRVVEDYNRDYYAQHTRTLSERLDEMYISNAVKRPIIRTLDICADVAKAMGGAPEKIFVEMARGANEDQRGKRTRTRKEQLLDLYKKVKTEDARALAKELDAMGVMADNRLQSDKLFLYYLQMGKCAYTGQPVDITRLADGTYNIDHIYPQAFVKDDSVLNNKVLVLSTVNGAKTNDYPVSGEIQQKMRGTWQLWLENGLMTEEKFRRLVRTTGFTEQERYDFINRQLVETRQSTKAVAALLQERYPEAEIVYVKAGLVSEFRQEFDMLKCRSVNNLHHAKDAYLNIVVGNVYNARFTKNFSFDRSYNIQVKKVFAGPVKCGKATVWQGGQDLAKVRAVMAKNAVHMTRYAFCRKGGLFDQQPVKAAAGLVPLKSGLPTEKYGGYNRTTAAFFALVKYTAGKKTDIMFVPVELLVASKFLADKQYAGEYIKRALEKILGKPVQTVDLLLNGRPVKINAVISVDGFEMYITGKGGGGLTILTAPLLPLVLDSESQRYVKRLESYQNKRANNSALLPDEEHDGISKQANLALYDVLCEKMNQPFYKRSPANMAAALNSGRDKFNEAGIVEQVGLLMGLLPWFNSTSARVDLTLIGGAKVAGYRQPSSSLGVWKTKCKEFKLVEKSASGIYESRSCNLLELL